MSPEENYRAKEFEEMCAKLAAPKVIITDDMKKIQDELTTFLKRNTTIKAKRLYPHGYEVNVGTIPEHLVEDFLSIVIKKP